MSGLINFYNSLRNYQFLDCHKSVIESQRDIHQANDRSSLDKLYNACWYNGAAIAAVGLDVVTGLAVSSLRQIGLCLPLPPAPPVFPTPHSNAQFLSYAAQRAIWNWDSKAAQEIQEGISDSFSDHWNVFQVVGEWSLAYALENSHKSPYYKTGPTFLTISEPLENGASYRSVSADFARLWAKEKSAILNALYSQTPPPALSSAATKVYQDIRSLASLLHQGNQNYLNAFREYAETIDVSPFPEPSSPQPSAPNLEPSPPRVRNLEEVQMAKNVALLRKAFTSALLSPLDRMRVFAAIQGRAPLQNFSPEFFLAKLAMLQLFQQGYQKNRFAECPDFISYDAVTQTGKSVRHAGCEFAALSDRDFAQLQAAAVSPSAENHLSLPLKEKYREVVEFAAQLQRTDAFQKTYRALQIDLLVN